MVKRVLTDGAVKRLKPPAKGQVDVFDKGYPGLALRISYGGNRSWVVFYRLGGRLHRLRLGTYPAVTLAEAREAWRKAREDVQAGRDPARGRPSGGGATDFAGVAKEWLQRDQAKNRRAKAVARIIERDVTPAWGHRDIASIGRREVLDVIDAIVDRGAPIMARRTQAHLHRLFQWAVGRGIVESNPLVALPKPGSETKRDRVLTDEELVAVWNGCGEIQWQFGNALRLLILTGARLNEVAHLHWAEIVGDEIQLEGARTKNDEPHTIPLSAAALAILEQIPRRADSPFVFVTSGTKPITGWPPQKDRLDDIAGIAPWRIHDLRRTVATGLQRLKTPLQVTEAILGHTAGSRAGVVGIYQRYDYADEKRAALEAWGAHVMAIVSGTERGKVLVWGR
jgi:integrase